MVDHYRYDNAGQRIEPNGYHVYNKKTQKVVGTYKDKLRATNAMNKKDNEYGGYAHSVKAHYEEITAKPKRPR